MLNNFPTFADGRYQIESRLGDGGMAAVFRAWDNRLQIHRAIKCLDPNLSMHPQIRQRFEAEAQTMASINHQNIVAIQDIGNIGTRFFIIMELLTGGSLWDRVERHGTLDPQYAIDAAIAMAKGLEAAHKCNIIHRDVKPHNVLISKEGVPKVTDFGIARIDNSGNKTKTGVMMGTLNYMAPEQRLSASRVTAASDLYAVGATLYATLTGQSNENLFDPAEQETAFSDLDPHLAAFLRKACHADPLQRHDDAAKMASELAELKALVPPVAEDAIPLYVPFETDGFNQKPTSKELTELHTSWSQYGSERQSQPSQADNSTTMNLFDDESEEFDPAESIEEIQNPAPVNQAEVPPEKGSSKPVYIGIALIAVTLLIGIIYAFSGSGPSDLSLETQGTTTQTEQNKSGTTSDPSGASNEPGETIQQTEQKAPPTDTKKPIGETLSLSTIALVPFETQSDNKKVQILASGLFQDISSDLSQSVAKLSIMPLQAAPKDLAKEAKRIRAGYIIEGNLQSFDHDLRVNIKLLDTERMSIVWSKTYKRNLSGSDLFVIQDEIVDEITDALVGNGFIMAEDVQRKAQKKGAKNLGVYECRNFAYRFYKTYLPADYEKVNTCLRESITVDPDYAELYYHLAHINFVAWQMGYKEDRGLITEAIAFADKSIALDPTKARGYFGKGLLSFVLQDWDTMHHFLQKAVKMAPNNVEILSNAGLLSITGGKCSLAQLRDKAGKLSDYTNGDCRWKPGMAMLKKAFELDKGNLYPVKNYGIAHVYNYWGDYEKAYDQMQLAVSPGMIWYEMHSAISAAGMKDAKLTEKHFAAVKAIIGSNKLNDVKAHFDRWHIPQYWEMSKDFLAQNGFE